MQTMISAPNEADAPTACRANHRPVASRSWVRAAPASSRPSWPGLLTRLRTLLQAGASRGCTRAASRLTLGTWKAIPPMSPAATIA